MNLGTLTVTLGVDMSQLSRIAPALNTTAQRFRTFGYLASAAITLPMVAAGKSAMNLAKEYEFSIQKIVGLTGTAQSMVKEWEVDVLRLAKAFGKSPQELAEGLYFIASSGIQGAEAMNVLELSAKAAAAGLGETQQMANVLTSALNAYRGTGLTAAYATDIIVAAVREGKAEASGFATSLGQIIPIASQLGVSFDQVAGGMAAITLTGASSSNAAVYLKGIFNSLLTASTQGEKALNQMNSSYKDLRNILETQGLIALMQKLRDMQSQYGDELLSDVLPNIRALNGFLSLAGKNFQYNTELMKRVTESTGALGDAWAAVADTIKVRYDQAISAAQVSMITLGKSIAEAFLPILEKLVGKLEDLTNWFNSLSEEQQRHKLVMLAWVAAAGPISMAISVIMYSISGLVAAFKSLNGVLTFMSKNPLVLLGTGLIAVVGWLIHAKNKARSAQKANLDLVDSMVAVGREMKRLSTISTDIGAMNLSQLIAAQMKADEDAKAASEARSKYQQMMDKELPTTALGVLGTALFKGGKMAGYEQYLKMLEEEELKKVAIYNALTEALENMINKGEIMGDQTKAEIVDRKEIQRIHRLILDQYNTRLKNENKLLSIKERIREIEAEAATRPDYSSMMNRFLAFPVNVATGPTKLESEYAQGLYTYKEYLDEKYKMDLANAAQSADARMKVETEHINNLRAYRRNELQTYLQATANAIDTISSLVEASKQRELSAVGDNAKNREAIERAYYEKQKKWAIAQALINGALAVTNMMANVPLSALNPATWVGIGIAAASTMAQIGIISAQKFAKGTDFAPGGMSLVGERGPELVNLPRGSQVIPNHLLGAATAGGGQVIFEIEGTKLVGVLQNQGRKSNSFR